MIADAAHSEDFHCIRNRKKPACGAYEIFPMTVEKGWVCFLAFRKGAVICCGLEPFWIDRKKNAVDREQMSPQKQFELPIA